MFLSKEQEARAYRANIDNALTRMEKTFHDFGGLDMDAYHSIQVNADNLARLCGVVFQYTPKYPNPCAEILLRSTRPDND